MFNFYGYTIAVGAKLANVDKTVWFVEYMPNSTDFIVSPDFLHCAAFSVKDGMKAAVEMRSFFGKNYKGPVFKVFNLRSHLTPQQLQLLRLQSA